MTTLAAIAARRSGLEQFDLRVEGVDLMPMPAVVDKMLGRRVQAITIGHAVMVKPGLFDDVMAGHQPELLAHELIHVAQWEESGIAVFLWNYLRDYVRLRMLGATHDAAYRSIGYEYQAYTRSRQIKEAI